MRFAIIGQSAEAVVLADSIRAATVHQLGPCCVAGSLAAAMTARGIAFPLVASPEDAIIDSGVDVVVVAETNVDTSISVARQASQTDRHVLVIPPDEVSTAYSFELHLLLDESNLGILPLTGRWYAEVDPASAEQMRENVQQLSLDLPLSDDTADLRRLQLHGVDTLCGCGYEYTRVTAVDVPGADGQLLSRSVTLSASDASSLQVPPGILTFRKELPLKVFTPADFQRDQPAASETKLVITRTDGTEQHITTALQTAAGSRIRPEDGVLVTRLVDHLTNRDKCQSDMDQFSNTLEMTAGLEKSLRRRRTIDVYFDGISERSAFKTQMTAIGCGVLTYVIFGMVAFLIMAQLTSLPPLALQIARIVWIAPVVLFLFAQFLLPLARERPKND
ncbi:MAG: hypothetical protein GY903_34460 [Fuerstiella sp.]|nr:hypothetical protein [Fuerstiella sp.]MCP4859594.1 hypothetical protein [Fuerstiella sp.]